MSHCLKMCCPFKSRCFFLLTYVFFSTHFTISYTDKPMSHVYICFFPLLQNFVWRMSKIVQCFEKCRDQKKRKKVLISEMLQRFQYILSHDLYCTNRITWSLSAFVDHLKTTMLICFGNSSKYYKKIHPTYYPIRSSWPQLDTWTMPRWRSAPLGDLFCDHSLSKLWQKHMYIHIIQICIWQETVRRLFSF